jgi:hypothetical protein
MNRNILLIGLGLISAVFMAGCHSEPQNEANAPFLPLKYKIDGNFEGWKSYETIQIDTGIDWSKVVVTPKYDGIQFHQYYEDNDSNYLYLFFKFKPSIQERYDKTPEGGDLDLGLGTLYIDTDANTNTGCTDLDTGGVPQSDHFRSGTGTIPGSEIQISLLFGIYADPETNLCYLSYEMKRWDPAAKSFDQTVRTADSREERALIAHGADGVEVALLLSDLRVTQGSKIALAYWDGWTPKEYIQRTTIRFR